MNRPRRGELPVFRGTQTRHAKVCQGKDQQNNRQIPPPPEILSCRHPSQSYDIYGTSLQYIYGTPVLLLAFLRK